MKRLFIAGAALGALVAAGPATAADISPVYKAPPAAAPIYDWTGFYIGVNAGYAWGHSDVASTFVCPAALPAFCTYNIPENLAAISAAGTGTLEPRGFTGGGQAGYNWQSGPVVFGLEADIEALDLRAARTAGGPIPSSPLTNFAVTTGIKTDWMATVRGRIGFTAAPTLLIYATGGWAVTDLQVTNGFMDTIGALFGPPVVNTVAASSATQTKSGWTAGGGFEWALSRNWTVRGEYLYVNFGSVTTTAAVINTSLAAGAVVNPLTTSADLSAHIARAAVNFRF
jgi:outer membrane immunogenic protein